MQTLTQTNSNKAIIQQAFVDFSAGNIGGIIDICTDDVQRLSHENPLVPFTGKFIGKEEVFRYFSRLVHEVNDTVFDPLEFFTDGDAVIVSGRHSGTVKKTGKVYDHCFCMIFKLRDEKIAEYFVFVDTLDQAEAFK